MEISNWDSAPAYDAGKIREGDYDNRVLLHGKEGAPGNYRVMLSSMDKEAWLTPRHRHNFEQIRFPIEGEFIYAKDKTLPAGWVGYFTEGQYYGPQVRSKGLFMLTCQYGGASGQGYLSRDQRRAAFDDLSKLGTFAKGAYTRIDENGKKHNKDAFEACWEYAMKRDLEYPEPRYEDLIIMNPDNYRWVADKSAPGVARKWMGTFTECEMRVGFVRLEKGAIFRGGAPEQQSFLFLSKGEISVDGRSYGKYSALGLEAGEVSPPIHADGESEFLQLWFPKL